MIILGGSATPRRRATEHVMAYVTAPDRESARKIARVVLEGHLAACANLAPIESLYWWHNRIEENPEVLVIFKTRRDRVDRLMAAVKSEHPYEIPCIVTYPMDAGFPPFLGWVDEVTGRQR